MANEKLLRGDNVGLWLAYPEAFADPTSPTADELNNVFDFSTNLDGLVFDITCATLDDYTMNMSDPETDDTLTACDIGNTETPTFDTYEVSLDFLRDSDVDAAGVFNLARELTLTADRPFWAIKRIGKSRTAPFSDDGSDVISMFGVITDNPTDGIEDNAPLTHGARFKNTGDLLVNYAVVD